MDCNLISGLYHVYGMVTSQNYKNLLTSNAKIERILQFLTTNKMP